MSDPYVRFKCPACGKRCKAPAEHVGKTGVCACGQRIIIPSPTAHELNPPPVRVQTPPQEQLEPAAPEYDDLETAPLEYEALPEPGRGFFNSIAHGIGIVIMALGSRTKRPRNGCKACGYTWYPRGKDVSAECPNCGGWDIELWPGATGVGCRMVIVVGLALGMLAIIALLKR